MNRSALEESFLPPFHDGMDELVEGLQQIERILCVCGAELGAASSNCARCRRPNALHALNRRRERLMFWCERTAAEELAQTLAERDLLLDAVRVFTGQLRVFVEREPPAARKDETPERYLRRLAGFMESNLTGLAPSRMARHVHDRFSRTCREFAFTAWRGSDLLLVDLLRAIPRRESGARLATQQRRVEADLNPLVTGFLKDLQGFKLHHDRVVRAYKDARPVLQRGYFGQGGKKLWDGLRARVSQRGAWFALPWAIWRDEGEKRAMDRLDQELRRFFDWSDHFFSAVAQFEAAMGAIHRRYGHAYAIHLVRRCFVEVALADRGPRRAMVLSLLAQRGVGPWYARWYYRRQAARLFGDRSAVVRWRSGY